MGGGAVLLCSFEALAADIAGEGFVCVVAPLVLFEALLEGTHFTTAGLRALVHLTHTEHAPVHIQTDSISCSGTQMDSMSRHTSVASII